MKPSSMAQGIYKHIKLLFCKFEIDWFVGPSRDRTILSTWKVGSAPSMFLGSAYDLFVNLFCFLKLESLWKVVLSAIRILLVPIMRPVSHIMPLLT